MVGLVDTAVLVDVLRQHPPALHWINQQTGLGICPLVYMELIQGAKNKIAQNKARDLAANYDMVYLTETDFDWAMQHHAAYSLSHGIGLIDCLIASVNARLNLPLYTRNLKHFSPLLGDLAQNPYTD